MAEKHDDIPFLPYKESLAVKIDILKNAIQSRQLVSFHYYYDKGEADKLIEPYLIIYRWSSWYIFGFCIQRQDFRLYKLNRLWQLKPTNVGYISREIPVDRLNFDSSLPDDYVISVLFESSEKFRLVDEYGEHCFTVNQDRRLLFTRGFTNIDVCIDWFLSFGDKAEVISPPEQRSIVYKKAENFYSIYN